MAELSQTPQEKPKQYLGGLKHGSKPWLVSFALFSGLLSILVAIIRYSFYPILLASFALYF